MTYFWCHSAVRSQRRTPRPSGGLIAAALWFFPGHSLNGSSCGMGSINVVPADIGFESH